MSIDLLADKQLDQVLRFFPVRRGAAGQWADAEVVATGANNPAVCRLWAAPLQYRCSSTRYLLQLERTDSRHWIGQLGRPASSAFACAVRRLRIGDDAVAAFKVHSHAEDLEEQFGGGPLA